MTTYNLLEKLPKKEYDIWLTLEGCGYQVFLVGGAVRDIVLGLEPNDWDFATDARPDEIIEAFSHDPSFPNVNLVGESFGVVMVEGVEVATFRGDKYNGGGDKDVEITYVDTIFEDLARRDFTVNAMAMDSDGEIADPFGGRCDLKIGRIRFVGNADDRIAEDPNRILRAFRFAARFDFAYDLETYKALERGVKEKFSMIAPERIQKEIMKTMESVPRASKFWADLLMSGVLAKIFPELADGWKHEGGKYHPETVWEHNMLAGDYVSCKRPLLKLTMYLHDIGKPLAWAELIERTDGEDEGFNGHDVIGENIVNERLADLKFSKEDVSFVAGLIRCHMRHVYDLSPRARRKLVRTFHDYGIDWKNYVLFKIADHHANLGRPDHTPENIKRMCFTFLSVDPALPMSAHALAVSGGELITNFGLKPGPIVSEVQQFLLEEALVSGCFCVKFLFESALFYLEQKGSWDPESGNYIQSEV